MNKAEFDEALVRAIPRLRRMVMHMTRDPVKCEDVVQDTIVNALTYYEQFEVRRELKGDIAAWLFTTARNKWRSQWRRAKRMVPTDDITLELMSDHQPAEQHSHIFLRELNDAIAKLPKTMQQIIGYALEGRTTAESAALMNVPEGTIKSRLFRAREKLSHLLKDPTLLKRGPWARDAYHKDRRPNYEELLHKEDLAAWRRLGRRVANGDASDASNAYPPVVPYQAPPPIDCGCIPRIPRSTLYAEHPQETTLPPMPGASGET